MNIWVATLGSVLVVSLFSFTGVLFLSLRRQVLERLLLFLISFAAGGLLGGAFLHLLPEAIEQGGSYLSVLVGVLSFFVLEKFICWRHCHTPTSKIHPHPLVFMNLIGDGIHNFIDGAVIATSFLCSRSLGLATTLAVVLHEIPQEIGDFGILVYAGMSRARALVFNFASALVALVGAISVLAFGPKMAGFSQIVLPFAAGGFIYIAGSDLLPELHKETDFQKSVWQLAALVLGIGLMLVLTKLEGR
jgi:zinc and cadmium transporter